MPAWYPHVFYAAEGVATETFESHVALYQYSDGLTVDPEVSVP